MKRLSLPLIFLSASLLAGACAIKSEITAGWGCNSNDDCLEGYTCMGVEERPADLPADQYFGQCFEDGGGNGGPCEDRDNDGFFAEYEPGACPAGILLDCDDTNPNIFPGAEEVCDGVDRNCNGIPDCRSAQDGECTSCTLFGDDGECLSGLPAEGCELQLGVCAGAERFCIDGSFQSCDEVYTELGYVGSEDICNGLDSNCNGHVDGNGPNDGVCDCDYAEDAPVPCSRDTGPCTRGLRFCLDNGQRLTSCIEMPIVNDECETNEDCGEFGFCVTEDNIDPVESVDDGCRRVQGVATDECSRRVCRALRTSESCSTAADCGGEETHACEDGICRPRCNTSADCFGADVCILDDPTDPGNGNGENGNGENGNGENGNGENGNGENGNEKGQGVAGGAGLCTAPSSCEADGDCLDNERCVFGYCQFRAVTQLPQEMETCNGMDDTCRGRVDNGSPISVCGACPFNMVRGQIRRPGAGAADSLCIDKYEASRPDATSTSAGDYSLYSVSRPGVLPWTNLTRDEASEACNGVNYRLLFADPPSQAVVIPNRRLCTRSEWEQMCAGFENSQEVRDYPYFTEAESCQTDEQCSESLEGTGWRCANQRCQKFLPGVCNDGTVESAGIAPTGSFPECRRDVSQLAGWQPTRPVGNEQTIEYDRQRFIYDQSGNVAEWVVFGQNVAMGGSYLNSEGTQLRCTSAEVVTAGSSADHIGFRCCASAN